METSCGVVLVNLGTVLLLQYPQGHWDLPKGHVEIDDENYRETMQRELMEETGIHEIVMIDGFELKTSYSYSYKGKTKQKQVIWYLAETETITVKLSHEHRDYLWLEWDQAIEHITHDETRQVVERAQEFYGRYIR